MFQGNRILDVYKFHVLITTYEVIISDLEELSAIDWRVAIIDEAHRLKNRNCKLLQGLSCFEMVRNSNGIGNAIDFLSFELNGNMRCIPMVCTVVSYFI